MNDSTIRSHICGICGIWPCAYKYLTFSGEHGFVRKDLTSCTKLSMKTSLEQIRAQGVL